MNILYIKKLILASIISTVIVALLLFSQKLNAQSMVANKDNVIAFYNLLINEKDFDAASKYLGSSYKQHNPLAEDGKEGLKKFIAYMKQSIPDFKADIKNAWADDDYVILHVHSKAKATDRGIAIVDIFKLDNKGKIIEHWDVTQSIPESMAHNNSMF